MSSVEEAALQTTSLPWNLELKAGRFFGEFGRLSYIHDHELPFVNRPLVLDQYIGGESQTDGVAAQLAAAARALRQPDRRRRAISSATTPNYPGNLPRLQRAGFLGAALDLFRLDAELATGSRRVRPVGTPRPDAAADQPPDGTTPTEQERRLAGLDLKFSYVPLRNNQFRSFTWGTEVLYSDNRYLFDPDGTARQRRRVLRRTSARSACIRM